MKLLCDACQRLLPPASWAVVDGALHLVCAGCGATAVRAPAAGATRPVEAPVTPRVPPPVEPAVTPGVTLHVLDGSTFGVTPPVSAPDTSGEPEGAGWLDAEWAALQARWEDPEAHRRLLVRAEVHDELAALGRRYKERLEALPGDPAARRAREELIARATAKLMIAPTRPAGGTKAKNVVAATVVLTAVGLLVVLLLRFFGAGAP